MCGENRINAATAKPVSAAAARRSTAPMRRWTIDSVSCTGCGVCAQICPFDAIEEVK
ncbi:MAG: 4Fe-4S binding protein [Anaerovoracaceae bacterium]